MAKVWLTVGSNSKGVFSASLLRTPLKLGMGRWRLDTKVASSALASVCESEKPGGGDGHTKQLSSILAVIQNKEHSEQLARPLRLSPSLLLCGQGYLQDRLTNNSLWLAP